MSVVHMLLDARGITVLGLRLQLLTDVVPTLQVTFMDNTTTCSVCLNLVGFPRMPTTSFSATTSIGVLRYIRCYDRDAHGTGCTIADLGFDGLFVG